MEEISKKDFQDVVIMLNRMEVKFDGMRVRIEEFKVDSAHMNERVAALESKVNYLAGATAIAMFLSPILFKKLGLL